MYVIKIKGRKGYLRRNRTNDNWSVARKIQNASYFDDDQPLPAQFFISNMNRTLTADEVYKAGLEVLNLKM